LLSAYQPQDLQISVSFVYVKQKESWWLVYFRFRRRTSSLTLHGNMWLPLHRQPCWLSRSRTQQREEDDYAWLPSHLNPVAKTDRIGECNVVLNGLEIGHSSIQGFRQAMEDQYIASVLESAPGHTLVAILDGHAGKMCAHLSSQHFCRILQSTQQWKDYLLLGAVTAGDSATKVEQKMGKLKQSLVQAYADLDEWLVEAEEMDMSGSTFVSALITPTHVICANVGDSRCVIGSNGVCINMSEDHKPELPEERARIESAGGCVLMNRVNGELAMSRAMGDFQYKMNPKLGPGEQMVTCFPDLAVHKRCGDDEALILVCDGVSDVIDNDDALMYVNDISLGEAPSVTAVEAAAALVDLALEMQTTDNISVLVVKFAKAGAGPGAGAWARAAAEDASEENAAAEEEEEQRVSKKAKVAKAW